MAPGTAAQWQRSSNNPRSFGFKLPTGHVRSFEFFKYHAYLGSRSSVSPKYRFVTAPARVVYSSSASGPDKASPFTCDAATPNDFFARISRICTRQFLRENFPEISLTSDSSELSSALPCCGQAESLFSHTPSGQRSSAPAQAE